MDPIAIIIIAVVAGSAAFIFFRNWLTKKNGIEAEAFVSHIEEEEHVDSDGSSTSYTYYVRYTDGSGCQQEARISNMGFSKGPVIGERIRIRYLPEKPQIAVWIR